MKQLRSQLMDRLAKLGVEERRWPGREDGFSTLLFCGKEFAHFHTDNELDLRLTRAVILREGLTHPADSSVHPNRSKNSQWFEIRFKTPADLERVVQLVNLAIQQL